MTEWDEFTRIDYKRVFDSMEKPAFIFDGRNLLDKDGLEAIGFVVYGGGKHTPMEEKLSGRAAEEAKIAEAAAADAGRCNRRFSP